MDAKEETEAWVVELLVELIRPVRVALINEPSEMPEFIEVTIKYQDIQAKIRVDLEKTNSQ